jgi:hypothetical protein
MNNNYVYAAARLNFIANNGNASKRDLSSLIRHGKLKNRIKAFYMLVASFVNMRKK